MGKSSVSARPSDYSPSSSNQNPMSSSKKSADPTSMNPPQNFTRDPQSYPKQDKQEYPYYGTEQRPRGDSIYLPPPVSSYRFVGEYDQPQNQSIPLPSRSNSIFSSLIQFPNSNSNSVSEPSRKRQMSTLPNQEINLQDIENYFNKESLGNLLAWQNPSRQNSHDKSAKSKGGSIDFSNPAVWESLNMNGGSIAGLNSGSLSGILAGIQNGSIDFTNMSEAQRRDSLLRLFSDPQQARSSDPANPTKLREDMFFSKTPSVNSKSSTRKNSEIPKPRSDTLKPPGAPEDPLSPTSSLSSKSSKHKPIHQSPKTSPASSFSQQLNSIPVQQQQPQRGFQNYQIPNNQYQYPNAYSNMNQPQLYNNQMRNGQQQFRMSQQYQSPPQPQFISPNFTNFQAQQQQPQSISQVPIQQLPPSANAVIQESSPKKRQKTSSRTKHVPATASPPAVSSADKAVIGATKIDQLMLVIQSRDKGNDLEIHQTDDGNIVGELKNKDLIGGIDKHKIDDYDTDGDDDKDGKRKKKKKLPQCPYCYKYFAQSTQLEVHVRSHIGYKPFECTYCHKRFTQGGNLTTHLRLHTGEKPFTCEICNRSFSRKGNLAAHKLTHENLKPFECKLDDCDKSFTQLGNLKSHQNKFHLDTLNMLTQKLATLSTEDLNLLPPKERELLDYFKDLYKNSNKGIKGRGKRDDKDEQASPPNTMITQPATQAGMRTNYNNTQYPYVNNNNYRNMNSNAASMINDLSYQG